MGYVVTNMLWGQIYLPVFQFFWSVMIPLQLDTGLIRDWCLVPYEAAEPRNSVSRHCYNRLRTNIYARVWLHALTHPIDPSVCHIAFGYETSCIALETKMICKTITRPISKQVF